jgi:ABC-2 type transport system ATP-binding protein
VIFLDEPTGSTRNLGSRWNTARTWPARATVLLTTQYLDEAEQLADRIAILHEDGSSRTAPSPS